MSHRFPPLAAPMRTNVNEVWLAQKIAPLRSLPIGEILVLGAFFCTLIAA
jgi:hypothetical protein